VETPLKPSIDRRRMPRLHSVDRHRIVSTRVRPGHAARIVDVSAGGALIDTTYRVLPGTSVELHVETRTRQTRIRGQVLRCSVVGLRSSQVSYRAAIRFDRHLPWIADDGSVTCSGVRPAFSSRAAATPEAI
jgi:PilZ domain